MIATIGVSVCLWFGANCSYWWKPISIYKESEIKQYIEMSFDQAGLSSRDALIIAKCESNFDPEAKHTNTNGSNDHGIFQINSIHKLPDSCRDGVECSTKWVIEKVKREQNWSAWRTCSKKLK